VVGSIIANKLGLKWHKRSKQYESNYFGSLTQASTIRIGVSGTDGRDMFIPFSHILPSVHPNDFVLGMSLSPWPRY
jgi:myo-inositol-1-phosphate synthase